MTKPKAADRHLHKQMIIWVPQELKEGFMELCAQEATNASEEIRRFMKRKVKAGKL